ncbi:hypothetical protein J5Y04_36900 [Kitasatospora sp. RG8]|uniref:beta-ketoacyl synthase N-terminal-like domain-containing protein n=1 Tax=Kitasatospora sp. RG8 TaxID=2820815 RepID=UPI001AE0BCE7|nr:beta-ketoacyl synthase N-terminal-like domain-containing protein [Kitasatospora sp. RG8]MBP0455057.1 hypothetical protein [Kitasatospora sp. RG8]
MTRNGRPLAAITGIGPVSRAAIGTAQLAAEHDPLGADAAEAVGAAPRIRPLDNFDPATYLGRRGWKFLPPVTRLALAAVRLALDDAGAQAVCGPERTGVVLGTNFAVSEVVDRIDRALLKDGISGISAVECPNFSINVPASQVSIAHGLKAFNITLVDLLAAGYEALLVAGWALRAGRADSVLAGAVEGLPQTAAHQVGGALLDAGGACVLHLESPELARRRGAEVRGWLTAGTSLLLPEAPEPAERALGSALERLGAEPPARLHLCGPAGEEEPGGWSVERSARDWAAHRSGATEVTVTRGAPQASATSVLALARHLARREPGDAVFAALGPQRRLVLLRVAPAVS